MTPSHLRVAISLLCLSLAVSACRREEAAPVPTPVPPPAAAPPPMAQPLRVNAVELGSAIGADKRVTAPSAAFAPADTIYASVSTAGASPSTTLTARWTYEDGQIVNESSETISPSGPAVTEFHIAKPDGWPAGRYKVEVSINGAPAAAREFEVR